MTLLPLLLCVLVGGHIAVSYDFSQLPLLDLFKPAILYLRMTNRLKFVLSSEQQLILQFKSNFPHQVGQQVYSYVRTFITRIITIIT